VGRNSIFGGFIKTVQSRYAMQVRAPSSPTTDRRSIPKSNPRRRNRPEMLETWSLGVRMDSEKGRESCESAFLGTHSYRSNSYPRCFIAPWLQIRISCRKWRVQVGRGVSRRWPQPISPEPWSRHSAGSAERLRCRRQASPLFHAQAFRGRPRTASAM